MKVDGFGCAFPVIPELHLKSPDFRRAKEPNLKSSWNTTEWVTEGFERDTQCYGAGIRASGSRSHGGCTAGSAVSLKVPQRDQLYWTALISQHIRSGDCRQALKIYAKMLEDGVKPTSYTFVAALKACSILKDLESAKQIHAEVVGSGFESNVIVGNVLVDVYAKCGSLVDARCVFEEMPHRDVVSWNAMILACSQSEVAGMALQLLARMQEEGVVPNDRTFVAALKASSRLVAAEEGKAVSILSKEQCLKEVRAIHSQAVKRGLHLAVFVGTMLVDVYAKCGSLVDARHVFDNMPHRNVVSWSAMILGYAQMEEGEEALQLYAQMQQEGVVPNDRTFVGTLKACSSLAASGKGSEADRVLLQKQCLKQVRAIHKCVIKSGFEVNVFVGTMLVDVYAKCGSLEDARCVFDKMPHPNVASWTAMILGYALMEEGHEALQLYTMMQQQGVLPDSRAFIGALKACISLAGVEQENGVDAKRVKDRCLQQVRTIHSHILKSGGQSNVFVGNTLVDAYAKCGSLVDAKDVFGKMPSRDVVSWTAIILGYAQMEEGHVALELYAQMQQEGVVPDSRAFVGAIKACGSVAGLEKGKEIHAQVLEARLEVEKPFVANSLIDMYAKCGSMVNAQQIFDALTAKDIVSWNTLMAGYARQGESELVFDMFERMQQGGVYPVALTFLNLLTVCSHVGLVEKGQKYFTAMSSEFGIPPTIAHYTCMVDLLGRAGHVEEAMAMATTMPFRPDGAVWEAVMAACQKWRNVAIGRHAFECALRLDRNDAAPYVLMSNIYAAAHMWEDCRKIQEMRSETVAWKQQGQSWWTDMSGTVHPFVVGHPESPQIHATLGYILIVMKEEGCVPRLVS